MRQREQLRAELASVKKQKEEDMNKLKREKLQYQTRRLEACLTTSDTWRMVKSWLGWKCGGPPTQLVVNGELKSKPRELSKCMNEYFVNKVRTLNYR